MSQENSDYELKVLKMAINLYLDETISITEDSLKALEANRDYFVWKAVTNIYTQSGYKLEFSTVRDVVNSRIEVMKTQLEDTRIEAAHRAAEEETARRVAEREAAQLEAARLAEKNARLRAQMLHVFENFVGEEDKVCLFLRVRKIVSEQLSVDEDNVDVSSDFFKDLGSVNEWNFMNLVMEIEEEFDIELSDNEIENHFGYNSIYGEHTVKNWVNYLYKKTAASA